MAAPGLQGIKGLLIDINGVLYVANKPLMGANQAITALKRSGLPYRFATNNTTRSVQTLSHDLTAMGLSVEPQDIISAPYAAVIYLRQLGQPTIYPLLSADAQQDFAEFTQSETAADVVVLGDMGYEWDYRVLNRAFRLVMQGAQLLALHKGKFWQWEAGLQLDIGAFVAGLEYATDQTARVVGKPSPFFFELALTELGLPPGQVAMIGDDIEADVAGAQQSGMKGVLVKTGKYRPTLVATTGITPDLLLEDVGAIAQWFQ
ncbi:MAG: TIGR01458 family HAD-type hydrolase [Leptolyngbya sp. RL_3_1]|nr:TIGR01458 family HAD-type hydrolase [Leptolyngbya sp. RL_3_1]